MEQKDAPHVDYMSKMLDMKLHPILLRLHAFKGVTSSGTTSQEGGQGVTQEGVVAHDDTV